MKKNIIFGILIGILFTIKVDASCPADQFLCDVTACKLNSWKCDGVKDCDDGTDEANCVKGSTTTSSTITPKSTTISSTQKSKSTTTTKSSAPEKSCSSNEFQCGNGDCVPKTWVCDGQKDCFGGEDEANCGGSSTSTTSKPDSKSKCSDTEFKCVDDERCIALSFRCNRKQDCDDMSDEIDCGSRSCRFNEFRCKKTKYCIFDTWVCDNKNDCVDGSDEDGCAGCTVKQFMCDDGLCVDKKSRCNTIIDCLDQSDEQNCTTFTSPIVCASHEFTCVSDNTCVGNSKKCDQIADCPDGSDEQGCNIELCQPTEFRCKNSGNCLLMKWVCDGFKDCFDGSDEVDCENTTKPSTTEMSPSTFSPFTLFDSPTSTSKMTTPVSTKSVTSAASTTSTTSPRSTNSTTSTPVLTCSSTEYICIPEQKCIPDHFKCNRKVDCSDLSDEINCGKRACESGEFRCNLTKYCIFNSWLCDNRNDCLDGSDEENCGQLCKDDQFMCSDGLCLPLSSRCDKLLDCPDGSDEKNCTSFRPTIPCNTNHFTCASDGSCIPISQRCNKVANCEDASDEYLCNTVPCKPNEYRCPKSGYCLNPEWVCDGFEDCFDKSDESDCGGNETTTSTLPAQCDEKICSSCITHGNTKSSTPSNFVKFGLYSIWVDAFPRKWLRAKQICQERNGRLVQFPRDADFSKQFLEYVKKNDMYGLNYWVGQPPTGSTEIIIPELDMEIPKWMLNGRKVNNFRNPMFARDCYFMDYVNLTIYKSGDCYDHAGFICQNNY